MIGIIDYGAGNLRSVKNALKNIGVKSELVSSEEKFNNYSGLILPGVGSFKAAMDMLNEKELSEPIKNWAKDDKPLLGICLGLQLMFERSEESEGTEGLGIFKGGFKKFAKSSLKVPQIGWNNVNVLNRNSIYSGLDNKYVYFVHSYYLEAEEKSIVAATCNYGITFDAAVEKGNVSASQFHPEKSGQAGLEVLRSFAKRCAEVEKC